LIGLQWDNRKARRTVQGPGALDFWTAGPVRGREIAISPHSARLLSFGRMK
jgi:hypothetical protein